MSFIPGARSIDYTNCTLLRGKSLLCEPSGVDSISM